MLLDENALLRADEGNSDQEDRFGLLGLSGQMRTCRVSLLPPGRRGHPLDLRTQGKFRERKQYDDRRMR